MNGMKTAGVFLAAVLFAVVTALSLHAATTQKNTGKATAGGTVDKSSRGGLGMPVLTGDVWQKMSQDSKVAFIWGFGHVVTIEDNLMEKYPELRRDNFSKKATEGMGNVPMNEVVARVDRFYSDHPEQIKEPVTRVIWDTMIRPNLKTGIAGRPLAKNSTTSPK